MDNIPVKCKLSTEESATSRMP